MLIFWYYKCYNVAMKLYKFRQLITDKDFDRIDQMLQTGSFWCSQFAEMNDPMEGVFSFPVDTPTKMNTLTQYVLGEKNSYKICSFSDRAGFENPLLWGHYANGFKGVAIEIDTDMNDIFKVIYANSIMDIKLIGQPAEDIVKEIIATKLTPWEYESEYRFLKKVEDNNQQIGSIKKIYFGNPYGNLYNSRLVYPKSILGYHALRGRLQSKAKEYNIPSALVKVNGIKVVEV
jgi:hypothetical protein